MAQARRAKGGGVSPDRPDVSWQHRAEQAERDLSRVQGALRLSQAVHRVLCQAADEAALSAQVCAALVEAGCLAAAWLAPGQPALLCAGPEAEADAAKLGRWFEAWNAVAAELAAVAVPLDGLFAAASRAGALILPLREGSDFLGAIAVVLAEGFGPQEVAALDQAAASMAWALAAGRVRARLAQQDVKRGRRDAQFAWAMSSIDDAVWTVSGRSGRWLYLNQAFERISGRPAADFLRDKHLWREIVHPEDVAVLEHSFSAPRAQGESGHVFRVVRPDGMVRWVEGRTSAIRDARGRVLHLAGAATDITEHILYAASLEYLATRDGLTGLPNRRVLVRRVGQALARARCGQGALALGVLNLDGLKLINNSLGHQAGDALLAAVAQRLRRVVGDPDALARLSGDEFALVFTDPTCPQALEDFGAAVLACFATPFAVGEHELHLSASLGLAVYPRDGEDTGTLLQHAHSALHSAQQEGGACWRLYVDRMSADAAERIRLDQALRGALDRGEFELHYQPQIDLRSGAITGVEALIRWAHPELGLVSPARFIPLAEETGLIVPLGEWVMRTACAQMRTWQQAGHAPQRLAVNLSARQLWQGQAAPMVARVLAETGLAPGSLELEITESVVMRDGAEAEQALSALRALGITLALDDFGTGYSSLSYLRSLPLNKLKIDRSFVQELGTRSDVAVLVQQIVQIGHAFRLRVVAEGVETQEAADFLARSGCDEAQGFYFARPQPASDIEARLRQQFRRAPTGPVEP